MRHVTSPDDAAAPGPPTQVPVPVPEQPSAGPAVAFAARLAGMAFAKPFRHYQELALQAFDAARAQDDRRIYLTMPPGSGKTVLGLEIGRRMGRPMVVLAPTAAIQAQWVQEWTSFQPPFEAAVGMATEAPVHALTYQSLVILDAEATDEPADELDEAPDAAPDHPDAEERARHRRLIVRGGGS